MAEAKVKYGSKKYQKMLSELCKEAAELSIDYNCKVGIFVTPKKIDENSTLYAFGAPSVESIMEKMKAKAEKKKKKKMMTHIKKKARLNFPEGSSVCGCKLGGPRVTVVTEDANVKFAEK